MSYDWTYKLDRENEITMLNKNLLGNPTLSGYKHPYKHLIIQLNFYLLNPLSLKPDGVNLERFKDLFI